MLNEIALIWADCIMFLINVALEKKKVLRSSVVPNKRKDMPGTRQQMLRNPGIS